MSVTICRISEVDDTKYDEIWAIVRSLKYKSPKLRHVPELSPSWALFKLYLRLRDEGNWNEETFQKIYVPQFLKEMRGEKQQALLNELYHTEKRICLVCFCTEESLCHRSIIGGMLQGAGASVKGLARDYGCYYDWWKKGVPKETGQIKQIREYNRNVVFLYELQKTLFEDNIPTMCFTGRRPKDLCGYDTAKYQGFVSSLSELLYREFYGKQGIRRFLNGGAQGFDQMAFWAVQRMKIAYGCEDAQNIICMPFEGQESRWAAKGCFSQTEYHLMLKHADHVVVVSDTNSIDALFERNHVMCNLSDICLGLYPDDEWQSAGGGTAECLRYARTHCDKVFRLGYSLEAGKLDPGVLTVIK